MEAKAQIENAAGMPELERVRRLEADYVMATYARQPVLFVRGKVSTLYDSNGRAYTDFLSGIGVNVLGYDHPAIRRVMREQASLMHTSNLYYHRYQGALAERLATTAGLSRVFFGNTGTEAVEGALKLARAWQRKQGHENKTEYVALKDSFHGRTMGALSVTEQAKYRAPFEPLVPGIHFLDPSDQGGLKDVVNERTAAVIIETIQGESGVRPIESQFLEAARKACDESGALLILDEVQCGLGRTGKTFAFENTAIKPDVLCVAKPLGLGVPLGAFIVGERAIDGLTAGDHGSTFGGGPVACRLSLEFMKMFGEGLMKTVSDVGDYFQKRMLKLQRSHASLIKQVRGLGLMLGMELAFPGKSVASRMLERGYVINCTNDTTLRFLPPYIIRKLEIRGMLGELEEVILEEGAKSLEGSQ